MVNITFPDGSARQFDDGITGSDIASSISTSLAKSAMVLEINGQQQDLSAVVTDDAIVRIITTKDTEALEIIRHDCAHVLATAVKEMYPNAQITIGPAIENGFYYDIAYDKSFTPEGLEAIEERMHDIIKRDDAFERQVWPRDSAIEFFRNMGEHYKAELIEAIPPGQDISLYKNGDFIDLCRGPHLPSTGRIGHAFKLMKLAGAYWRGDSSNAMLQRIYGTAWATQDQLKQHLHLLEEAEKRDHRKLGRQTNLFHLQKEAAGSIFWHPKGWQLYLTIQEYMRSRLQQEDYVEVNTPQLVDISLWVASGHTEKFKEEMFLLETSEGQGMGIKPMNCPCHVQIFKQGMKSYRDLPIRMAEFGSCHRNEPSGALHGLFRLRGFTQDDAHIFCTQEQVQEETAKFCKLLSSVYADFGFKDVKVKFSDRPEKRAGEDATWDKAESMLRNGADMAGLEYTINSGEGAFYGPKLEFVLTDAIGRDWQCGTLQLDFVLPERLGATYIGADNEKHRPVMLHRAILGSFERFIGILIENCEGKFPLWLAPQQAVVAPISIEQNEYAQEVVEKLRAKGLRVELDLRHEKINYKIREHSLAKIPMILVVGAREVQENSVTVRRLGSKDARTIVMDDLIMEMQREISSRA